MRGRCPNGILTEKFGYVLEKAAKLAPAELVAILRAMHTPEGLAWLALFAGLEVASDLAGGVGLAANAALIALLWTTSGISAVYGAIAFGKFLLRTFGAKSRPDLDAAAQDLVQAAVLLGTAGLTFLGGWAKAQELVERSSLGGEAEEAAEVSATSDRPPATRQAAPPSEKAPAAADKPTLSEFQYKGLRAQRILQGKPDRVAVIGRVMGDASRPGVRDYAAALREQGYKVDTFDGDAISPEAKAEWDQLTAGGKRLSNDELMSTKLYEENEAWANRLKTNDSTVIDLGNPYGSDPSAFYEMEKLVVFGDTP